MKKHKWHKEIKAWADGAEIEFYFKGIWISDGDPKWNKNSVYRIKPQYKEWQGLTDDEMLELEIEHVDYEAFKAGYINRTFARVIEQALKDKNDNR